MILLYEGQSTFIVYMYIGVAHGPAGPAMAGPFFFFETDFLKFKSIATFYRLLDLERKGREVLTDVINLPNVL